MLVWICLSLGTLDQTLLPGLFTDLSSLLPSLVWKDVVIQHGCWEEGTWFGGTRSFYQRFKKIFRDLKVKLWYHTIFLQQRTTSTTPTKMQVQVFLVADMATTVSCSPAMLPNEWTDWWKRYTSVIIQHKQLVTVIEPQSTQKRYM